MLDPKKQTDADIIAKMHEDVPPKKESKKVLSSRDIIDPEHDPVLHRKNKPHTGPSNYDPKWQHYRSEEE